MTEDQTVVAKLQGLARHCTSQLPPKWGFVLLAFPFGPGGRMNYVANAQRADVIRAMYEFISQSQAGWGEHLPEPEGSQLDTELGRLHQEVARLQEENRRLAQRLLTQVTDGQARN